MLLADDRTVYGQPYLKSGRLYFIDFGCSRRLALGPGSQPAIELPDTIWDRPREGITRFDPYAWDMFRLGHVFLIELKVGRFSQSCVHAIADTCGGDIIEQNLRVPIPRMVMWYARWLRGEEREGCMGTVGVCRCRPTAATALRVFRIMRGVLYVQDWCVRMFARVKAVLFSSRKST